jgi:hypothetical protein
LADEADLMSTVALVKQHVSLVAVGAGALERLAALAAQSFHTLWIPTVIDDDAVAVA